MPQDAPWLAGRLRVTPRSAAGPGRRTSAGTPAGSWKDAAAWRVQGPPPHARLLTFVRNLVVGTSLTTLLLVGTVAFLFLAMDIPGMLAAGIPDKDIPDNGRGISGSSSGRRCSAGSGTSSAGAR